MKPLITLIILSLAGGVSAADTYRWVDEKGVVNYGEKPPANRSAKPVSTQPSGVIETGGAPAQKPEPEKLREAPRVATAPEVLPPPPPSPRGMEFDTYIRLQRGMTEGELILRAGRPDYESVDRYDYAVIKTLYYFPTLANPYTTVVTLRGGRIHELDRIKKF